MHWSGMFNSNNQDRVYDASQFALFFSNLISSGVCYTTVDNLLTTAGTGMTVNVAPGSAWINGYCFVLMDSLEFPLAVAHGAQPRIDRIIIRWSLPDRAINLAVLTGAANPNPAPPTLTRTPEVYELGIANILVSAGVITIPPANTTDTRADPTVCGLVNSLVAAVYQ
jgi:hypothetical protein